MMQAINMPATTPAQIAAQTAAIAAARNSLQAIANHPVTPAVVGRVDGLLGLPATDPTIGVTDE